MQILLSPNTPLAWFADRFRRSLNRRDRNPLFMFVTQPVWSSRYQFVPMVPTDNNYNQTTFDEVAKCIK